MGVMEDGGMSLFEFTTKCHKMITLGWLSIGEWQAAVRTLFRQMVEFVDWMHSKMNICHLDISLENLLISDVFVSPQQQGNGGAIKMHFSPNMTVKFCDFGLATMFDGKDFQCNKYVGKCGMCGDCSVLGIPRIMWSIWQGTKRPKCIRESPCLMPELPIFGRSEWCFSC